MTHPPRKTTIEIDMKELRELKELLQIVLDNIHRMYYGGLCILTTDLVILNIITKEEEKILDKHILDRPPYFKDVKGEKVIIERAYRWEPNEKKPRIEWLKQEIKRMKSK